MMPLAKWQEQSGEPHFISRISQNQREKFRGNLYWRKPYKAIPRNRNPCQCHDNPALALCTARASPEGSLVLTVPKARCGWCVAGFALDEWEKQNKILSESDLSYYTSRSAIASLLQNTATRISALIAKIPPSVVPNIEVELSTTALVQASLRLTHLARTPGLLACHNTGVLDANPHLMEVDRLLGEILAIFRLLSSDSAPGLCSVVPENLLFHQHLP